MKENLTIKLCKEIDSGIVSEAQVVYILAGIRKILEQLDEPTRFGHLKFYCDWALHSRLSKRPAQKVVKTLEFIYKCMEKNERVPEHAEAMLLVRFELLKEELSTFLMSLNLTDFTKNTNAWVVFMYLYSRVVQDCPLDMPINLQINIKRIIVKLDTAKELIDDHLPYQVNWQFEAKGDLPPARYFIINSYCVSEIGRL